MINIYRGTVRLANKEELVLFFSSEEFNPDCMYNCTKNNSKKVHSVKGSDFAVVYKITQEVVYSKYNVEKKRKELEKVLT